IAIAAIMRKDIVQARFTVARREGAVRPGTVPQPPPAAVPAMRPATGAHQHPPPQAFAQTQQGTGAPQAHPPPAQQAQSQPRQQVAQASPIHPILSETLSSPPPPMTPPMMQGGAQQLPGIKPGASSGKLPVAP